MQRFLYTACVILCAAPAIAAPADSTAVDLGLAVAPDVAGMVTRMVLSLGVVLLVIWAAVHFLQRLSGKSSPLSKSTAHIRVLDRAYLAPKKAVYVLQIGSRSLAVGVTDHQITPLAELDGDETRAAYPDPAALNGTPAFANLLKDVRSKFAGGSPS